MQTYLESLRSQLRSVAADLDNMDRHMAGTEGHLDRVAEARFLVREIERLNEDTEDEGTDGEWIETRYCECGNLLIGAETCTNCTPALILKPLVRPAKSGRKSSPSRPRRLIAMAV